MIFKESQDMRLLVELIKPNFYGLQLVDIIVPNTILHFLSAFIVFVKAVTICSLIAPSKWIVHEILVDYDFLPP